MPRLTAIRERRGVARVYVEGELYAELGRDFVSSRVLFEGQELSEAALKELRIEGERDLAMSRALRFIGYRARAEGEVRDRLIKQGHSWETVAEVIRRLQELRYLDDEEFARAFTAERCGRYGPRRVYSELLRLGVSEAVAGCCVAEMAGDEESQLQRARMLARRKYNNISEKESEKLARRVYNFLLRRGYSTAICAEVAREYRDIS